MSNLDCPWPDVTHNRGYHDGYGDLDADLDGDAGEVDRSKRTLSRPMWLDGKTWTLWKTSWTFRS